LIYTLQQETGLGGIDQKKMENFGNEIAFNLKVFHYLATFFPFVSVIICWIIYYSCGHQITEYLPTISVTMIPFPESRIFAVTMSVEAIFILIILIIRVLTFYCLFKKQNTQTLCNKALLILTALSGVVCTIGLIVLACVTLMDNLYVHNTFAAIFFFGSAIHYLLSDKTMKNCGLKVSRISFIVTILIVIFIFLYMAILLIRTDTAMTFAAIGQYISCVLIFLKFFLIYRDLPQNTFLVQRNTSDPEKNGE
jgi:hypothetical protein